jgi:hypothetical protein
VTAFVDVLEQLGSDSGFEPGRSSSDDGGDAAAIIDETGRSLLPLLIDAGRGASPPRTSAHTTTASLNITAAYQRMRHITCDFAKA